MKNLQRIRKPQINNKGQVVGASVDNQGEYHSLLATPEP